MASDFRVPMNVVTARALAGLLSRASWYASRGNFVQHDELVDKARNLAAGVRPSEYGKDWELCDMLQVSLPRGHHKELAQLAEDNLAAVERSLYVPRRESAVREEVQAFVAQARARLFQAELAFDHDRL